MKIDDVYAGMVGLRDGPAEARQFYSTKEIAATLQIKEAVVRSWIREKHLEAIKFRKTYRVPAEAYKNLLANGLK
jgi:excisionase family DNA binding protein